MDQEPPTQESGIGEEKVAPLSAYGVKITGVLRLAPQDARAALPQNCHTTSPSLGPADPFVHITLVTSDFDLLADGRQGLK